MHCTIVIAPTRHHQRCLGSRQKENYDDDGVTSLIRFGHTKALLFEKIWHKMAIFPTLQKLTHMCNFSLMWPVGWNIWMTWHTCCKDVGLPIAMSKIWSVLLLLLVDNEWGKFVLTLYMICPSTFTFLYYFSWSPPSILGTCICTVKIPIWGRIWSQVKKSTLYHLHHDSVVVRLFFTLWFIMSPQIAKIMSFFKILWLSILSRSLAFTLGLYQAKTINQKLNSWGGQSWWLMDSGLPT